MRVVLTTFGSLGDLHPYLAIALELKARGHEPIIATSALYRERIESEGVEFRAVRPDLPSGDEARVLAERVMDARNGTRWLFRRLMMPNLRDSYADLNEACRDADFLVSHPITFAAPIVAQKRHLPWLSVVLSPVSLWSMHDPPVPPALPLGYLLPRAGMPINRLFFGAAKIVARHWLRPVDELRKELGLSSHLHPMFEGAHSPYGTLALFSRVLSEPQPDWPPRTTSCGFCFYDRNAQTDRMKSGVHIPAERVQSTAERVQSTAGSVLSPELERFLSDGEAPIVFTLGSAAVWTARDFWGQSFAIANRLGRRAVFLVGAREEWPRELKLGENHFVADYAPFSALFGRAALVVHQGGVGTTGQALAGGVPQLVTPFSHDQPDNGARVARLKCGKTLPRSRYSAARAAPLMASLLNEARYGQRARQIAEIVRAENGPVSACDVIENVRD